MAAEPAAGFIDLRVRGRHEGSHSDDSVWPSFTDIMTVVVMIFLMALVVILIRNVELVRAERDATAGRIVLEQRLNQMERSIADIRVRLLRAQSERDATAGRLAASREETRALTNDLLALRLVRDQLQRSRDQLLAQNRALGRDFESAQQSIGDLERQKQALALEITALQEERARLQREKFAAEAEAEESGRRFDLLSAVYAGLETEKLTLEERADLLEQKLGALEQQHSTLQTEHSALRTEYERLVGLARSEVGRVVVRIRYRAEGEARLIQLAEPGAAGFTEVSRAEMEARLEELSREHPQNLYTKIIIPEDSGLSYSEALDFTQDVLRKYDYYHQ